MSARDKVAGRDPVAGPDHVAPRRALVVRDSAPQDLPAIRDIYAHHVSHGFASFEEVPPDLVEMERRRAEILARGLPYLVAVLPGAPVAGYAYASPFRTRSAYRFTLENSVYVAQDMHRRGVGRALLAALLPRCAALGYRQMIAVIGDSGNHASIGLHAAAGFVEVGRLRSVGFKLGRWVDSVLMERPLGPGDSTLPTG
jgi:phosphinothricin acetyltransferase